jgi:hypothetical protein
MNYRGGRDVGEIADSALNNVLHPPEDGPADPHQDDRGPGRERSR